MDYFTKIDGKNELSNKDLLLLFFLSFSFNDFTRNKVAEVLCRKKSIFSEIILLKMTFDPDEIVRINAVDSICIGNRKITMKRLVKLSHSKDELVRAYSFLSLIDVLENRNNIKEKNIYFKYIKKRMKKEKNNKVLLMVNSSLYSLGYRKQGMIIYKIIEQELSGKLEDFWLIMNIIDEIADKSNGIYLLNIINKIEINTVYSKQKERVIQSKEKIKRILTYEK